MSIDNGAIFAPATTKMSKKGADLVLNTLKAFRNFIKAIFQEDLSTLTSVIHMINNWNPKRK